MPVELEAFWQEKYASGHELAQVRGVAGRLLRHLNSPAAGRRIAEANRPGVSSHEVQLTFADFAQELGFVSEAKGLFATHKTSALRPDYYLPLQDSGILLEVERGKTTINNMDLLDFWKCHLCEHAHYLFLLVPKELRQNATMAPRKEFASVVKRLSTFFHPHTYTNVRGLFVFGY
jgi:hypothetical protein